MSDTTNFLRLEEVAMRLRISYTQARMLVLYDEAIPHFRIGARGIRIREADLEAYIAGRAVKGEEATESSSQSTTKEPYVGRQILSEGK